MGAFILVTLVAFPMQMYQRPTWLNVTHAFAGEYASEAACKVAGQRLVDVKMSKDVTTWFVCLPKGNT